MLEKLSGLLGSGGLTGLGLGSAGQLADGVFSALLGNGGDSDGSGGVGMTSDSVDPQTQAALNMLKDMTDGGMQGYWKWLMKQIREKVMGEMGVSEQSLAAMDPTKRAAVEKEIADEVKKRLMEAMGKGADQGADAGANDTSKDPLLNPAMANAQATEKAVKDGQVGATQSASQIEANKVYKDLISLF